MALADFSHFNFLLIDLVLLTLELQILSVL